MPPSDHESPETAALQIQEYEEDRFLPNGFMKLTGPAVEIVRLDDFNVPHDHSWPHPEALRWVTQDDATANDPHLQRTTVEFASANWLPIAIFREGWYIVQKDPDLRIGALRCNPDDLVDRLLALATIHHRDRDATDRPRYTDPEEALIDRATALVHTGLNQRLARAAAFLAKQWPGKSRLNKDDGLRVVQHAADDRRHFLDEWDH